MQTEDKIWLTGILIDTIGEEYDKMIQLAISKMAPLTGLSTLAEHMAQVQTILNNMNEGDFTGFEYIEHLCKNVYIDVGFEGEYFGEGYDDDVDYINAIL